MKWRGRIRRRPLGMLIGLWACFAGGVGIWHQVKSLPPGLVQAGAWRKAGHVEFLRDVTYVDGAGQRQTDPQIFDRMLRIIGPAEHLLVLDQFLFNDYLGAATNAVRGLSGELTDAILRRREECPGLRCWFITDPINTVYGGQESAHLERLRRGGVVVVTTRLARLRDSNPIYSAAWRTGLRAWPRGWGPRLPNPFGRGQVPISCYFELMNFKANHRKTLVADRDGELVGLVSSANPHDGSSAHHNVALEFSGPAAGDLLASEAAVCGWSGQPMPEWPWAAGGDPDGDGPVRVRILTENAIARACLELIRESQPGDRLDLAMFYLSSRPVIQALVRAHARGVRIRVLLDPNKDAFGIEKNGIPNRPVGKELVRAGIAVRWAQTHGEQFHSKLIRLRPVVGPDTVMLGSANYTRRNLDNYNLETCVQLQGPADAGVFGDIDGYLELVWSNVGGRGISTEYSHYADDSFLRYWLYRFQEATGLSTF